MVDLPDTPALEMIDWCVYEDGSCRKSHWHRGARPMEPSEIEAESFNVTIGGVYDDAELTLECHAYGRGCFWEVYPDKGVTLRELLAAAQEHVEERHRG